MSLQSSGPISFLNIRTQLGTSGPLSLGSTAARGLSGDITGPVKMNDFYGKPVHGSQNFTTPGTYTFTVPYGISSLSVNVIGAGGGGGGGGYNCGDGGAGAGGGSGGHQSVNLTVVGGQTYTVTVGAGGLHGVNNQTCHGGLQCTTGANGSSQTGGTGGTSSISGSAGTVSSTGGGGGQGSTSYGCYSGGSGGYPSGVAGPTNCTDAGNQAGAPTGPGGSNGTGYGTGGHSGTNNGVCASDGVAGAVLISW